MSAIKRVLFCLFLIFLFMTRGRVTWADEGRPYGDYKRGSADSGYGEKHPVSSVEEAGKVLKDYFMGKDVKIGEIREQGLFFEAEIRDRKNTLIDKVVVDKKTGRIRSTY